MTQREITTPVPLLGKHGNLLYPGWSRHMNWVYNRDSVRARPLGLKEWDFYQVAFGRYVLQLTAGHVSYVANFSALLIDTVSGELREFSIMEPLPLRRLDLGANPEKPHRITIQRASFELVFETQLDYRHLKLRGSNEAGPVEIDLKLPERGDDAMVIATPFAKPHQFYLNCKAAYFGVTGFVRFGDLRLDATGRETAIMDWGRGVWPLHQEWFWGAGASWVGPDRFGFNLGWGFGDLRYASENLFWWNGVAHKLGRLIVERDESDYLAPWSFRDLAGQFELTMTPVFDHATRIAVGPLSKACHQVHGLFSGRINLPDGPDATIENVFAFCEHAVNTW